MKTKIGSLILGVVVVLIATATLFAQKAQTNNNIQKVDEKIEMQRPPMMMNIMENMPGDSIPKNRMKNCMAMMNNSSMMKDGMMKNKMMDTGMMNQMSSVKNDSTRQSMMKNCMAMMKEHHSIMKTSKTSHTNKDVNY